MPNISKNTLMGKRKQQQNTSCYGLDKMSCARCGPTGCCLEILGHMELSSTPPSLPLLVYTFSHHFLLLSSSASKLLVQTGMGWKCNGWRPYEMGTVLYFKKETSHLLFKVVFKIPVTNWMVLTFLDTACTIYCILDFLICLWSICVLP